MIAAKTPPTEPPIAAAGELSGLLGVLEDSGDVEAVLVGDEVGKVDKATEVVGGDVVTVVVSTDEGLGSRNVKLFDTIVTSESTSVTVRT